MIDKLKTTPPKSSKTSTLSTQQLDSQNIDFNLHDQYLEQLHRQYNIQVNHAILFYIADQKDPLIFVDKDKIVIGRQDPNGRINPEFDVTQFDESESGVSRIHAKIVRDKNRYLVEDVGSTNGTRINGHKLVPYQYTELTDGSVMQVGRLLMKVFVINRD